MIKKNHIKKLLVLTAYVVYAITTTMPPQNEVQVNDFPWINVLSQGQLDKHKSGTHQQWTEIWILEFCTLPCQETVRNGELVELLLVQLGSILIRMAD